MIKSFLTTVPPKVLIEVNKLDLNIQSKRCESSVNELLSKTVLVGGKRLRPLLTYLIANLFGVELKKVKTYAQAIELVHAASLSHDDVIDNATLRRGAPSINIVSSNKKAVLAGDFLLADVIVNLTKEGNLDLVQEMSYVIQDLAQGEWIQADAIVDRNYTREMIRDIADKKTASVMSWCCVAPAYLANYPKNVIEYARSFGKHLGIAFQLMDDTLDFNQNSNKDINLDLENGTVNSVLFEWLELNPECFAKFRKGEDISNIFTEDNLVEAISKIQTEAMSHLDKASELLEIIANETGIVNNKNFQKNIRPIHKILDYLGNRDL